jgi:hypothetical protein
LTWRPPSTTSPRTGSRLTRSISIRTSRSEARWRITNHAIFSIAISLNYRRTSCAPLGNWCDSSFADGKSACGRSSRVSVRKNAAVFRNALCPNVVWSARREWLRKRTPTDMSGISFPVNRHGRGDLDYLKDHGRPRNPPADAER